LRIVLIPAVCLVLIVTLLMTIVVVVVVVEADLELERRITSLLVLYHPRERKGRLAGSSVEVEVQIFYLINSVVKV